MCGIFGYIGKKTKAPQIVFAGLKSLEYRGYDSWGLALINSGNTLSVVKNVGKLPKSNPTSEKNSCLALGHTRWATHGGVTVKNAHPHQDCNSRFALIHNGIIENYAEIRDKLQKKGHKFVSETDTEVAVHLIEEIAKNYDLEKSVITAFKQFKGLNAIIVLDSKTGLIAAAKNGSPLIIGKGEAENFLASDAHALLKHTKLLYFMEDMEVVILEKDRIKIIDLETEKEKSAEFTKIDWNIAEAEIGKNKHFMQKEIFDQVRIIENIANSPDDNIKRFSQLIKNSFGTYLVGCGTAGYACLAGTYIFSKISKTHVNFSVASEFAYLLDFITSKSLVIGLSQSGETIDLIDALKKAKIKKAKIASLVNVLGSTLYRFADEKLLLTAGVEKAVVSTKAFTAKIAILLLIAFELSGNINEGKKILHKASLALKKLLSDSFLKRIEKLAGKLVKKDHIYTVGRGMSYPIALEAALKIKEASYIHAEGFAGGELKHGVIALIEKDTPVIAFVPDDETYSDTISGVMEMKARGANTIGIGTKNHEVFAEFIEIDDCSHASIIPSVVVGQLLGYFLAVQKGLDPDMPRNLAKAVTVK